MVSATRRHDLARNLHGHEYTALSLLVLRIPIFGWTASLLTQLLTELQAEPDKNQLLDAPI